MILCQELVHLNPSKISRNQKWRGPAPILIGNDEFRIVSNGTEIISELIDSVNLMET